MNEKKKTGLDIARAGTLVQAWQVMSWERNALPHDADLEDICARIAADPENAELYKEKGLALAGLDRVIETAANSRWYSAFACLAAHVDKNAERRETR